jgi:hypothetical protein
MKFHRKLIKTSDKYVMVSIPKPIADSWASVTHCELEFNESKNSIVISPATGEFRQLNKKKIDEERL